ncbi:unnamed protein product [Fusarium fujikuroi]|uniref:Uncharacterized protein n=1 Tax=Fusarium fujikuroi TaxID=5127 RepID=A0A9Q9RY04_FUSFU|nr:unnamed protein product [Fusarium fujikuroi]VTT78700.1 unnamed protein product [Fusarium fujikuroi]VZH87994.1 unnamed protein product [Fusarium fujikuroi]
MTGYHWLSKVSSISVAPHQCSEYDGFNLHNGASYGHGPPLLVRPLKVRAIEWRNIISISNFFLSFLVRSERTDKETRPLKIGPVDSRWMTDTAPEAVNQSLGLSAWPGNFRRAWHNVEMIWKRGKPLAFRAGRNGKIIPRLSGVCLRTINLKGWSSSRTRSLWAVISLDLGISKGEQAELIGLNGHVKRGNTHVDISSPNYYYSMARHTPTNRHFQSVLPPFLCLGSQGGDTEMWKLASQGPAPKRRRQQIPRALPIHGLELE